MYARNPFRDKAKVLKMLQCQLLEYVISLLCRNVKMCTKAQGEKSSSRPCSPPSSPEADTGHIAGFFQKFSIHRKEIQTLEWVFSSDLCFTGVGAGLRTMVLITLGLLTAPLGGWSLFLLIELPRSFRSFRQLLSGLLYGGRAHRRFKFSPVDGP